MSLKQVKIILNLEDYWTQGDIQFLIQYCDRSEDLNTEFECPNCGHEIDLSFDFNPPLKKELSLKTRRLESQNFNEKIIINNEPEVLIRKIGSRNMRSIQEHTHKEPDICLRPLFKPRQPKLTIRSLKKQPPLKSKQKKVITAFQEIHSVQDIPINVAQQMGIDSYHRSPTPPLELNSDIEESDSNGETIEAEVKNTSNEHISPSNDASLESDTTIKISESGDGLTVQKLNPLKKKPNTTCKHCTPPVKLSASYLLREHIRRRHPEVAQKLKIAYEPFLCTYCGKKFLTRKQYTQHVQIHTHPEKFVCKVCQRNFTSITHVKRHLNTVHLGIRRHVCTVCGSSYSQSNSLKEHVMLKHEGGKIPEYRLKQRQRKQMMQMALKDLESS